MEQVFNAVIEALAIHFDIEVVLLLLLVSRLCNLLGRLIPDDKTGLLGYVRVACKIIGLYARNRTTSGKI